MTYSYYRRLLPFIAIGISCSVNAQSELVLEEIIVSAQKRQQSLQDVPVSVSAFAGDSLKAQGIENPIDFNDKVPNVSLAFNTGEQMSVNIRGVQSTFFTANTSSPAGFYLDEVYIGARSAQFPQFFDLDRVEVLRGPQGTLYGRNTTAGAFNFISRKPTGEGDGYVELTYGKYGQLDLQAAAEASINDNWSIRFAGQSRQFDGYGSNSAGNPINDRDDLAARISLRYQNETVDAVLRAFGNRTRNSGVYYKEGFSDPDGTDPRSAYFWDPTYVPDPDPHVNDASQQWNDVDNLGTTLSVDVDFDVTTLTSITSFVRSDNDMLHDFDGRPGVLGHIDPSSSSSEQFSQELRLTSHGDGPFSWILGANYYRFELDNLDAYKVDLASVFVPVPPGALILDVDASGSEIDTSTAIFADTNYQISDRVRLNAGVRYTQDEKQFNYTVVNPLTVFVDSPESLAAGVTTDASGVVATANNTEKWSEPTYKVGIDFDVTDDAMLYATFSHGYRAGGNNMAPWFETSEAIPFDPEEIDSLEIGVKSMWAGGRVRANFSAFYYEFENIQVSVQGPVGLVIANAASSKAKGAELDLQAVLTDNWDLSVALGYLSGEYEDFGTRSGETFGDDWNGNLFTEYRIPAKSGEFFLRADATYNPKTSFHGIDSPFYFERDGWWSAAAQVGYRSDSSPYEITLWARNAADKIVTTGSSTVSPWMLQTTYNEPRTYGIRFKYSFE